MNNLACRNAYYRFYKTLPSIIRAQSPVATYNAFAFQAARMVNASASLVYLQDNSESPPEFKACWSQKSSPTSSLERLTNPLAEWVTSRRRSHFITLPQERWEMQVESLLVENLQNVLAVPILAKTRAIGTLELINISGSLAPDDEETLLLLAHLAARKLFMKSSLADNESLQKFIQHIRSPLTTFNTIAFLLSQPDLPDHQRMELLNSLQSESSLMNDIMENYAELTELETGQTGLEKTRTDLHTLLQAIFNQASAIAASKQVTLSCNFLGTIPYLYLDAPKMERVFQQLLLNAINYNRINGRVNLTAWVDDKSVFINFQDTGNGIPEGDLPNIFKKFYRAHNAEKKIPGAGLGLAFCKQVIEAHDGEIVIKSRLSCGTAITVQLPLMESV